MVSQVITLRLKDKELDFIKRLSKISNSDRSYAVRVLIDNGWEPLTEWGFAFNSPQDWHIKPGQGTLKVENDDLYVPGRDGSVDPTLYISGIEEIIGKGNKAIEVNMKIKPATGHRVTNCCKFNLSYTVRTGSRLDKKLVAEMQFSATDDGKLHLYRTKIPQIAEIAVNQIELIFKGFKKGDMATVDYIRLIKQK